MVILPPLEYPLRCVTLLLRTILILFQDTVDNTDERIELRADRRPRPDITRWHRIAQHLPDRARVDPKTTSRFALAQTLNHYRVANPPIQFHSLHPPPFAPKCKGLSLTEFCSGATRLSGRFSEGLLLRRSHRAALSSRRMALIVLTMSDFEHRHWRANSTTVVLSISTAPRRAIEFASAASISTTDGQGRLRPRNISQSRERPMQNGHAISRSRSTLNKSQRRPRIREGLALSGAVVAESKLRASKSKPRSASSNVGRGFLWG